jgi:hypothetical protein
MRKRYKGLSYGTPLALSDEMILATLDGQKTHTIRALSRKEAEKLQEEVNGWPCFWSAADEEWKRLPGPYGEVGDYLWVRESYRVRSGKTEYRLDEDPHHETPNSDWMPVVGMPEECSRLCLQITGYRFAKSIQALKVMDIYRDGFSSTFEGKRAKADLRNQFARYWNTRYRDPLDKWEADPSAWITEFRLLTPEESAALKKAKDFLK